MKQSHFFIYWRCTQITERISILKPSRCPLSTSLFAFLSYLFQYFLSIYFQVNPLKEKELHILTPYMNNLRLTRNFCFSLINDPLRHNRRKSAIDPSHNKFIQNTWSHYFFITLLMPPFALLSITDSITKTCIHTQKSNLIIRQMNELKVTYLVTENL